MLFSEEDVFMNERDDSVTVSTKSRKVTLQEGSSHMLPVINRPSFSYLHERKKRKHAFNCEASTSAAVGGYKFSSLINDFFGGGGYKFSGWIWGDINLVA